MATRFFPLLLALAISGCRYEVPLESSARLSVDHQMAGTWRKLDSERDERVQVIPFSDSEYLFNYHVNDNVLYLRGYPVEFNGRHYVQLEFIGTDDEVIKQDERKFDVIRYNVTGNKVSVWRVNSDIVNKEIESTEALRENFRQHADNKELFSKFAEFKKQG